MPLFWICFWNISSRAFCSYYPVDKWKYSAQIKPFTLIRKKSFIFKTSLVNWNKSAENCGFAHIYLRNPWRKTSFFVRCYISISSSASRTERIQSNEMFLLQYYFHLIFLNALFLSGIQMLFTWDWQWLSQNLKEKILIKIQMTSKVLNGFKFWVLNSRSKFD